eukprot:scaffold16219_cov102-Isochrysis_galbana.AAC.9
MPGRLRRVSSGSGSWCVGTGLRRVRPGTGQARDFGSLVCRHGSEAGPTPDCRQLPRPPIFPKDSVSKFLAPAPFPPVYVKSAFGFLLAGPECRG